MVAACTVLELLCYCSVSFQVTSEGPTTGITEKKKKKKEKKKKGPRSYSTALMRLASTYFTA